MANAPKLILSAIISAFIFNPSGFAFCDDTWELVSGIKESNLKEVTTAEKDIIYTASSNNLYKTEDAGLTWNVVFSGKANSGKINFISIFGGRVFICAENGLFAGSGNQGWHRIFRGANDKESNVSHIAFSGSGSVYIATDDGLFVTRDNGAVWAKDFAAKSDNTVKWVECSGDAVFIATQKGVYRYLAGRWERVFVTARENAEYDADIADELLEANKPVNSILAYEAEVLLATDSGMFISKDKGGTWAGFTSAGLSSLKIKRILRNGGRLYAITDKGVFVFLEGSNVWQNLYKGMSTKKVNSMTIDFECNIWLATGKGLYMKRSCAIVSAGQEAIPDILESFDSEPNISDVQKAAIDYAEVSSDKIKKWREAAARKALLPTVSVGADRYVTDYWHWDSGTNPDTLQKGKDAVAWDITMSWDLGDCVWNSDQTSIDTRSKLMVELRDDILSEVTRAYFERRRIQVDLLTSASKDLKFTTDKELRLQELTADIDAMTGGYFSKNIKK